MRMFPYSAGPGLTLGHKIYFSAGILMKAKGLAVITVVKAGFLVTARGGSGIVIAKLDDGIINSGMRGFLVTAKGGSCIVIAKLDDGIINSGMRGVSGHSKGRQRHCYC